MVDQRTLTLFPHPFVAQTAWKGAQVVALRGDASARHYWRLFRGGESAICMLMPPPTTSINDAHCPQSSLIPFVAVADYLRSLGLSAPEIYAYDLELGSAILEDLGEMDYARLQAHHVREAFYEEALEVLFALHTRPHPARLPAGGTLYALPSYQVSTMMDELKVWGEWFLDERTWLSVKDDYEGAWRQVLEQVALRPQPTIILRDFHSPNLLWCQDRAPRQRLGILDFQDAALGAGAYDLVSLLQDAREDVSQRLEEQLLDIYLQKKNASNFSKDVPEGNFLETYACLGAQRATKILGIFRRLEKREGKPGYLKNIPRVLSYLKRNFSLHGWGEGRLKEVAKIMEPLLP